MDLCVIVKNEEEFIERCLSSVSGIVDQIILVDTGSTDRTLELAKPFDPKVVEFPWNGNFSDARNAGLEKAQSDWILVLDADESIASKDAQKLKKLATDAGEGVFGYLLPVRNYTDDASAAQWHSSTGDSYEESSCAAGWYETKVLRLFRNDPTIRFEGNIHESVNASVTAAGTVEEAGIPIHHFGRLKKAEAKKEKDELYTTLLGEKAKESGDFKAYFQAGVQAQESGDLGKAIESFEAAIQQNPDFVKSWINLGGIYSMAGDLSKAEQVLREAVRRDPKHPEAHNNLGVVLMKREEQDKALKEFAVATRLKPDFAAAYKNLGVALDRAKRYQEAETALRRAVELNPAYRKIINID